MPMCSALSMLELQPKISTRNQLQDTLTALKISRKTPLTSNSKTIITDEENSVIIYGKL